MMKSELIRRDLLTKCEVLEETIRIDALEFEIDMTNELEALMDIKSLAFQLSKGCSELGDVITDENALEFEINELESKIDTLAIEIQRLMDIGAKRYIKNSNFNKMFVSIDNKIREYANNGVNFKLDSPKDWTTILMDMLKHWKYSSIEVNGLISEDNILSAYIDRNQLKKYLKSFHTWYSKFISIKVTDMGHLMIQKQIAEIELDYYRHIKECCK